MSIHTSAVLYIIVIPLVVAGLGWYVRGKQRDKIRKQWAERFRDEGFSEDEVEVLIPYAIYTLHERGRLAITLVGILFGILLLAFVGAVLDGMLGAAIGFGGPLILLAVVVFLGLRRHTRAKTIRTLLEDRPRDLIEEGDSALGFSIDVGEYTAPNPDVQAETNGAVSKRVYDTSDGSVVYFSVSDPKDVDVVEQDGKLELVAGESQVVGTVDLSRFTLGDVEYTDEEILVHLSRGISED